MNEQQFRQRLIEKGYGEGEYKEFMPNTDGPLHAHDFSAMLYVVSGEFTLAREDDVTTYQPGEVCELTAGIKHTERTGDSGAGVIVGRKYSG